MTKKILISWLGSADIEKLGSGNENDCGALHTVLTDNQYGPFNELILFMTPPDPNWHAQKKENWESTLAKLEALCANNNMEMRTCLSPENFVVVDMESVYRFMIAKLGALIHEKPGKKPMLFYNLTSGTSAMYAIQLYLASQGDFYGTPLYTLRTGPENRYAVIAASLPFMLGREEESSKSSLAPYTEPNQSIYDQVRIKVANSDASVLICGETGTGKTMLARYIHAHDQMRNKLEMVEVNCAALGTDANSRISELFGHIRGAFTGADKSREGAFQRANGSTLFLDEIGEIPIEHQGLLLRAIADSRVKPLGSEKEEEVHVRIIAATNVDLPSAVRAGKFRADLYYRLAHYSPRLKSIMEYTPAQKEKLLGLLLEKINAKYHSHNPRSLSADAFRLLLNHPWYGNIREMEFRLRSICLLADHLVRAEDVAEQLSAMPAIEGNQAITGALPTKIPPTDGISLESEIPENLPSWIESWEKYWIRSATSHYPKIADAASRLGMKKSTFFNRKLKLDL